MLQLCFLYLETDNDPNQFQELDGIVKSKIFSKKESKTVEISVKSSTVTRENKENIPLKEKGVETTKVARNLDSNNCHRIPKSNDDVKVKEDINSSKKKEETGVNEANFNVVASSSDLFSSVSESCDEKHQGKEKFIIF